MCQLFWMFVAQFSAWRLVSVPPNLYHSLVSENHFGNTVYIMIIRCSSLTRLFHEICSSLWWYILRCTLLNNFNSNEKNNYLVFILIMMQICFFKLSSTVLVVIWSVINSIDDAICFTFIALYSTISKSILYVHLLPFRMRFRLLWLLWDLKLVIKCVLEEVRYIIIWFSCFHLQIS